MKRVSHQKLLELIQPTIETAREMLKKQQPLTLEDVLRKMKDVAGKEDK